MKRIAFFCTLVCAVLSAAAHAQISSSQVPLTPGSSITTTVKSDDSTITTKVATAPGHSTMTKLQDGRQLELDSDDSVHIV